LFFSPCNRSPPVGDLKRLRSFGEFCRKGNASKGREAIEDIVENYSSLQQ
jgi:hypothetical protein